MVLTASTTYNKSKSSVSTIRKASRAHPYRVTLSEQKEVNELISSVNRLNIQPSRRRTLNKSHRVKEQPWMGVFYPSPLRFRRKVAQYTTDDDDVDSESSCSSSYSRESTPDLTEDEHVRPYSREASPSPEPQCYATHIEDEHVANYPTAFFSQGPPSYPDIYNHEDDSLVSACSNLSINEERNPSNSLPLWESWTIRQGCLVDNLPTELVQAPRLDTRYCLSSSVSWGNTIDTDMEMDDDEDIDY